MTHQGAAFDTASVHFGATVRITDISAIQAQYWHSATASCRSSFSRTSPVFLFAQVRRQHVKRWRHGSMTSAVCAVWRWLTWCAGCPLWSRDPCWTRGTRCWTSCFWCCAAAERRSACVPLKLNYKIYCTPCSEQVCRSSLLSGRDVRWPNRILHRRRNRGTGWRGLDASPQLSSKRARPVFLH